MVSPSRILHRAQGSLTMAPVPQGLTSLLGFPQAQGSPGCLLLPVVADGCDFPQNGSLSLSYLVCGVHCPHSNTPVEHNSDRTLVPKSAGEDPISKWGPMLRSQVTHLLEKSLFPSVLWNSTIFQYGGLAQWSG
jgi:hypothetical protein